MHSASKFLCFMICAGPLWGEEERAESWVHLPGAGVPNVRGNSQKTDALSSITDGERRPPGTPRDGVEPGKDIYLSCKSNLEAVTIFTLHWICKNYVVLSCQGSYELNRNLALFQAPQNCQSVSKTVEENLSSCQRLENTGNGEHSSTEPQQQRDPYRYFRPRSASDTTITTLHLSELSSTCFQLSNTLGIFKYSLK